jgi:predicted kinase
MKPLFFTMMGHSGSGKSHFAKQLAEQIKAVRLNSDSIRAIMFHDPEEALNPEGYALVFGALDYSASEVVKSGHSVIYDSKSNKQSLRDKNSKIAQSNGADHIVLWVETPIDKALQRATERPEALDQRQLSSDKVEVHKNKLFEEPGPDELYIKIDGQTSFDEQYKSFVDQLAKLNLR